MSTVAAAYQTWLGNIQQIETIRKVFVVGCPKSGTTWLMNLLGAHPQIVMRGEGKFGWTLLPGVVRLIEQFNRDLLCDVARFRDLEKLGLLRTAGNAVFMRYIEEAASHGTDPRTIRVVGDKTPQHTVSMDLLAGVYPQARFIHIIRDPRDAATSAWFHLGQNDPREFEQYVRYFMTEVWPLQVGSASRSGKRITDRYMQLRYEDLHSDEGHHTREMLDFLGVEATPEIIERCLNGGDFKRLSKGRDRGTTGKGFYRRGVVGDWREHLPPQLVTECCTKIKVLMTKCGYHPRGVNPGPHPTIRV